MLKGIKMHLKNIRKLDACQWKQFPAISEAKYILFLSVISVMKDLGTNIITEFKQGSDKLLLKHTDNWLIKLIEMNEQAGHF